MSARPDTACPKCGWVYGFLHSQPSYRTSTSNWGHQKRIDGRDRSEWLEWSCQTCGYIVLTVTSDAQKENA